MCILSHFLNLKNVNNKNEEEDLSFTIYMSLEYPKTLRAPYFWEWRGKDDLWCLMEGTF